MAGPVSRSCASACCTPHDCGTAARQVREIPQASRRIIVWLRSPDALCSRSTWASSTCLICSRTKPRRATSRRSSATVFGGKSAPSGVRSASSRSAACRSIGLMPRTPRRIRLALIRLATRARSPTRFSRLRVGRLASSTSKVSAAAMLQSPRQHRDQALLPALPFFPGEESGSQFASSSACLVECELAPV